MLGVRLDVGLFDAAPKLPHRDRPVRDHQETNKRHLSGMVTDPSGACLNEA